MVSILYGSYLHTKISSDNVYKHAYIFGRNITKLLLSLLLLFLMNITSNGITVSEVIRTGKIILSVETNGSIVLRMVLSL